MKWNEIETNETNEMKLCKDCMNGVGYVSINEFLSNAFVYFINIKRFSFISK